MKIAEKHLQKIQKADIHYIYTEKREDIHRCTEQELI